MLAGTLYQDVEKELSRKGGSVADIIVHIDYNNYDRHRHKVRIVEKTPLHHWIHESLEKGKMENIIRGRRGWGIGSFPWRLSLMGLNSQVVRS